VKCNVKLIWSSDSGSWYTISNDIPGLALGAMTFDNLVEKVRIATPEILELNLGYKGAIELHFEAERIELLDAI